MVMKRRLIIRAMFGGFLGLLAFIVVLCGYFTLHPIGSVCLWDGGPYWVFEKDTRFGRMLANRFRTAPEKRNEVCILYFEYGFLQWWNLYGDATAQRIPLAVFLGASAVLAADYFRRTGPAGRAS